MLCSRRPFSFLDLWLVLAQWGRLGVTGFAEGIAQPFESFIETITGCGTGGLDILYNKSAIVRGGTMSGDLTQARCRRLCRPSLSVISAAFMAFWNTSAREQ
jgi:hypothetical protein